MSLLPWISGSKLTSRLEVGIHWYFEIVSRDLFCGQQDQGKGKRGLAIGFHWQARKYDGIGILINRECIHEHGEQGFSSRDKTEAVRCTIFYYCKIEHQMITGFIMSLFVLDSRE